MSADTQKQIASLKIEEIVPDAEPVILPAAMPEKLPSLWAAAFEKLTTKEKSSIKSLVAKIGEPVEHIVGEIRDEVKKQGDLHQGKKWTIECCGKKIVLQEVIEKIMIWLDKFKDLGDVISSYDPVHLALPWAGFRFLIQATVAHGKMMGELLVGLETAMYLINRFQIYEILYLSTDQPKSKAKDNLTLAVVATYTSILRFLAAANKTYSDNPARRTVRAIFSPDQVSSLLSDCQERAAEANIDADNCERSSNQSAREDLIKVRRMLQGLEDVFKSKLNAIWEESRSDERVRMLQWISEIPYEDMHDQSKVGRMDGTGLWLLEEKKFRLWRETQSPMTLWLYGPPGQGKTKLISLAVDTLLAKLNNDQALAYFYCNRKQADRQTPDSIMRSCLRQLATSRNNEDVVHTALGNLYRKAKSKAFAGNNLSLDTMKQEFINIADTFSTIIIVVDAFDECELESRADLIESFREIAAETATPVKILISTRPTDDINYYMNSEPNIELTSIHNRHDIARFVKESIDVQPKGSPNSKFWREQITEELKQEICQVLIEKSEGMFLWAKLQIAQLRELKSADQIRKRLGTLPQKLHTLYDEIWEQIQEDKNENMAIIAERAIQILSCAFQPLSPDKLLVAVCQDPETDTVQEDINIDIDYVLDACRSLLGVDHHENICRLSHLSVYEYFEARGWSECPPHAFMAEVCLKLVIHTASADFSMLSYPGHGMSGKSEFANYNCASFYGNNATKKESELRIFSLIPYAYYHWPLHAQACDKEKGSYSYNRLANRLRSFFGPMNEGSVAYDRWKLVCSHWLYKTDMYKWGSFYPEGPPVDVVTFFGFDSILPNWWESGFRDVNSDDHGELLKLAIRAGSLPKVKWLLESGVVFDDQAVKYAVESNYLAITKLLLEHGFAGDMTDLLRVPALRGNTDLVQLLVDFGADIRRSGALASVADKFSPHQERMLSFLLKLGADPSIDYSYFPWCSGGALAIAVHRGNERVTKLILESAPFLARAKNDKSLLPVAVFVQNARIVEMLLDHGADLDTPGGSWQYYYGEDPSNVPEIFKVGEKRKDLISYDTPLTEAIKTLNPEIARLLLCRGANLDNPDRRLISVFEIVRNNFRTNDISGTKEGRDEKNAQLMVKLLLDYGADTNAVEAKHGSVLAAAASIGSLSVVEMLVHQGADVNSQGGEQNISPLIAAVEGSRECREERFYVSVIQFLLEQGADVNARGGEYGSALAAATHWIYDIDYSRVRGGYTEHIYGYTIETPLNAGDLASEELRGALYLKRGKVIVEMLRKHGAQVIDTAAREKAYSERWKS